MFLINMRRYKCYYLSFWIVISLTFGLLFWKNHSYVKMNWSLFVGDGEIEDFSDMDWDSKAEVDIGAEEAMYNEAGETLEPNQEYNDQHIEPNKEYADKCIESNQGYDDQPLEPLKVKGFDKDKLEDSNIRNAMVLIDLPEGSQNLEDENNNVEYKSGTLIGKNGELINPLQLKPGLESLIPQYKLYASISYCKPDTLKNWECLPCKKASRLKIISSHHNLRTQAYGFVAETIGSKEIIISFRGSTKLKNFKFDAKFTKKRFNPIDDRFDSLFLDKIRVHNGMLQTMESIIEEIILSLKENYGERLSDYKLTLVGHSLGGGVATLSAVRLKNNIPQLSYDQISVYTFGQPRTGNSIFAQWYNSLPMTSLRVVAEGDIVPILKFKKLDFAHFNHEYYIDYNGKGKYCSPKTPPPYIIEINRLGVKPKKLSPKKKSFNVMYFEDPECSSSKLYSNFNIKPNLHNVYLNDSMTCVSLIPTKKWKIVKCIEKFKRMHED